MIRWQIRRLYIPLGVVETSKLRDSAAKSYGFGTVPTVFRETNEAWEVAEELAAAGWEPFAAVPLAGGAFKYPDEAEWVEMVRVRHGSAIAYAPTSGVWLLFRREIPEK